MKKNLLIITLMTFIFVTSANAEKKTSQADVIRLERESILHGIERSPVILPSITIVYDTDTKAIEFDCSIETDVIVYLSDTYGNIIDMSYSLDDIIYLPEISSTILNIRIESNYWYAMSNIKI